MILKEDDLSMLDDNQKGQVLMQREKQQHQDFQTVFAITPFGETLDNFIIKEGVRDPTIVSARHHAAYLFYHNGIYYRKEVLDIWCGTGLMWIVMAKYGAKKVLMADISKKAVENTQANIHHFWLENASVTESDLFSNITGKFDCITFMQPYFAGNPLEGDTISASMLANPGLIRRFLQEAKKHLNPWWVIIMPSFSLAWELNDPVIIGKEFGYEVNTTFITDSISGLQQGTIAMHELRLPFTQ